MRVDELGGSDLGRGVGAVAVHDQPVALFYVPHAGRVEGEGPGEEQDVS